MMKLNHLYNHVLFLFDGKSPCGQCEKCQEWFECAMPLDDNGEVIFDEDIARKYGFIDGDNFIIRTNKE